MLGGNAARFYGVDTAKLVPLVEQIGIDAGQFQIPDSKFQT
jgi:hypothetical protein